jgi:probable rRNA maturation factor
VNPPPRLLTIANQHPRLRISSRAVSRAIAILDAEFAGRPTAGHRARPTCPSGELSIVFLTDEALAELHARFLDDPSITDVITFEGDPALGVAGEVCVSADAAIRQTAAPAGARHRSGRADAFARELTLYVVHGWLHLAGYDDLQPAKKRVMRRAEARALRLLDGHGAVPDFRLR